MDIRENKNVAEKIVWSSFACKLILVPFNLIIMLNSFCIFHLQAITGIMRKEDKVIVPIITSLKTLQPRILRFL